MIAAPLPTPGQCWSLYRASYTGERADNLPAGESAFVLATTQADTLTFLSLEAIQRFDVRANDFVKMRAKRMEYPPRKLAAHIRAVMSRNERHKQIVDQEIADLALTALGWKEDVTPQPSEKDMLNIAVGESQFSSPHAARRSAVRKLGKPDAREGVDFEIKPLGGGKVAMTLKTGANGKTEKIAAGPTGIARQYERPSRKGLKLTVNDKATPALAAFAKRAEFAEAALDHAAAGTLALAVPKKPAGKPAKAPKVRPAKKKRSAKDAKAAGAGIAAAIAERHGADVFKGKRETAPNTMNGAKIKNGPSKAQIVADLLCRKEGATAAECLAATGWKQISISATLAKRMGLKLRKEKDGKATRYYGSR